MPFLCSIRCILLPEICFRVTKDLRFFSLGQVTTAQSWYRRKCQDVFSWGNVAPPKLDGSIQSLIYLLGSSHELGLLNTGNKTKKGQTMRYDFLNIVNNKSLFCLKKS